jgi:hypothetical protein
MTIGLNLRMAALAAAFSSLAGAALAAGSITTTAPANVTVLSPTTITKTQDMAFGVVVRPSNTGTNTVLLDTSNTVTLSGAGNGSIVASATTSAKFNLNASPGTTYTTIQSLIFTDPALTGVSASAPAATSGVFGTIPAGGVQEIRYGGQFDMTASTPAKTYSGALTVTVNYD